VNSGSIWSFILATKEAIEVQCGWASPDKLMKVMLVSQALAMRRLVINPREYPNNIIFSITVGG